MKFIKLLTFTGLIISIVSCSTTSKKNQVTVVPDCVYPNTQTLAPNWICDEPVANLEIQSVGIADSSAAGISFMKDLAAADARGKIAEQFKVQVQKMVKSYFGTTGVTDDKTVDRVAESVLKTITNETLVGSKIYKSRTGPNGKLYVLVGLDSVAVEQATKKLVKSSMGDENALWQQFKAKQGFDEMAEDIAKQKVQ